MRWTPLRLRLVSPVLMWLIVVAGAAAVMTYLPHRALFAGNTFTIALLVVSALNWVYFFFGTLRVNRQAPRSAAVIRRLVTTGVYARVRHPIYSADIFLAWGVFLVFPQIRILVSVIWLTVVLIAWMKLEEAALFYRFAEEYVLYKARTPMIVPRIFGGGHSAEV